MREKNYNQWREETLRNPFRDEHLTVELPLKISILNGRVEALIERSSHPYPQLFAAQSWDGSGRAVSHLFFPMNQYATVEGTEDFLPQQMYVGANEIKYTRGGDCEQGMTMCAAFPFLKKRVNPM